LSGRPEKHGNDKHDDRGRSCLHFLGLLANRAWLQPAGKMAHRAFHREPKIASTLHRLRK
jgi:hypothetical protein